MWKYSLRIFRRSKIEGGGGGNKVQADQEKGIAKASVPPGVPDETKELRADDKDEEAPAVNKTVATKPQAKVINQNASIVKTNPKPVVETPAPPRPKAVAGKTLTGTGTGGGTADKYDVAVCRAAIVLELVPGWWWARWQYRWRNGTGLGRCGPRKLVAPETL